VGWVPAGPLRRSACAQPWASSGQSSGRGVSIAPAWLAGRGRPDAVPATHAVPAIHAVLAIHAILASHAVLAIRAVLPAAIATRPVPRCRVGDRACGAPWRAARPCGTVRGGRRGGSDRCRGRRRGAGGPRRRTGQGAGQRLLDERRRSITSRRVSWHRVERLRGRPHGAPVGRGSGAGGITPLPRLGPALDRGHEAGSCAGRWGTRPSRRRPADDRPAATGNHAVRGVPRARNSGLTRVNLIVKVDYVHRLTGVRRLAGSGGPPGSLAPTGFGRLAGSSGRVVGRGRR
jgi:hypothetical protein